MIVHIALFRLKDEAAGRDKSANIAILLDHVRAMAKEITVAKSFEAGRHHEVAAVPFPAFDFAIEIRFDNDADYVAYMDHPLHKQARDFAASIAEAVSGITIRNEVQG